MLVAVAAEADDKSIWSRLKMLPELFAAGPVAIRVGFFGAEGARSSSTVYGLALDHRPRRFGRSSAEGPYPLHLRLLRQGQQHSRAGAAGDAARAVASRGHHRRFFLRRLRGGDRDRQATARGRDPAFPVPARPLRFHGAGIPGARGDNRRRPFSSSIPTSSSSRNGCRDCLRRSPISRSAAWQLWKRAATRRPVCYSNR